jgi:GntR family transcriptional repressor for pyruvate dehydrogenase complex
MQDLPAFTPMSRRRLSDELVERILASIAAGELCPGDRLPTIVETARSFGVGASTVREALMRLEAKGVVEIRHGAGVFVVGSAA